MALQLDLSKLADSSQSTIGRSRLRQLDTYTSCCRANHWIRLGGLDRAGRYVRDPAVILIERAHQSPKCNTHDPISRATPSYLSRHALSAHFVLTSVKRDAGPTARCGILFSLLSTTIRSRLASIISYASLNKSARMAITIDIACLPSLSSRRPFHLFRLARGPNIHARPSRLRLGQVRKI